MAILGTSETFYDNVSGLTLNLLVQGAKIGSTQSIVLKINSKQLTISPYSGASNDDGPIEINIKQLSGNDTSAEPSTPYVEDISTKVRAVSSLSEYSIQDGDYIYWIIQPYFGSAQTNYKSALNSLCTFRLKYVGNTTAATLDSTSIQVATKEEAVKLNQDDAAVLTDGDDTSYEYAKSAAYDSTHIEMAKPQIIYPNYDQEPSLEYTGATVTADKTSVTVNGTTGDTVTATATATPDGAKVTGSGTWGVYSDTNGTAYTGKGVSKGTVTVASDSKSSSFAVNVANNAATGTFYIGYKNSSSDTIHYSSAITVSRVEAKAKEMTLAIDNSDPITILESGNVTRTVTVQSMKDQYGDAFTGGTTTWSNTITPKTTGAAVTGVTVNDGTVTVNPGATECTVTVTATNGNASASKVITVSAKQLTTVNVTGASSAITKTYDGTTAIDGVQTFKTNDSSVTVEVASGNLEFNSKNAGTQSIKTPTAGITFKKNGVVSTDYQLGDFAASGTISKATLTVTGMTAENKAYNGKTDATVTGGTLSGVKTGDTVSIDAAKTKAVFENASVGTSKKVTVTVALTGTDAANYTVADFDLTADITGEAVTVSRKPSATITGTSPKLSDLLTATPAGVDLDKIEGATVKYYEKVVTPANAEDGTEETTTYNPVDTLETGKTYYVDVSFGKQTIGNYEVAALTAGFDATAADPVANCVALTCNAAASSGGYTGGGTTAPAPQEETPTVIDSFIKGYEDGTVGPNNSLTRAETAVIMARLSKGFDKDSVYYGSAPDVQPGEASDWYYTHVNYDIQKGIINGYPDGNFYPNEKITRAEFAAMLARFMGLDTTGTASFDDVNTEEYAWASGYVAALEKVGVVNGYEGSNDFKPGAPISRAEAIKMIVIALGVDTETATQNTSVEVPSDLSTSHWAYKYIMAALSTDVADIAR
jgi:hypothetical protein